MRGAAILFLIIGLIAHGLRFSSTLAQFSINQNEIAKKLCVKKDVANNTCQGKCHLAKMMKAAEHEGEEKVPAPDQLPVFMPLPVQEKLEWQCFGALLNEILIYKHQGLPDVIRPGIAHPPRV